MFSRPRRIAQALEPGSGYAVCFGACRLPAPGMPVRTDPDPSRKGQGRFLGRPPRHHDGWSRSTMWEERINPAGPALSLKRAICLADKLGLSPVEFDKDGGCSCFGDWH